MGKHCTIFLLLLLVLVTFKIACGSCPVSPSTVKIVDRCPNSKDEWDKAAARKNCSAYASKCDQPKKLVYHCVINTFVNETYEVCAYGMTIHSGHCTEYSKSGNRIQQSFRTNCTLFLQNPCPNTYYSTDAYQYPGCYDLTKQNEIHGTTGTTQPSQEANTSVPSQNQSSHLERS